MCAYNGLPFIREAVDGFLGQTYPNIELVISDDGSNDGTRDYLRTLEGDARVRLFFQQKNLGYVANKNFVHGQARGEFVTQQDNDDTSTPDRLDRQYRALQDSGLSIAACGYFRINKAGEAHSPVSLPEDTVIAAKGEAPYPFWFPALMVHRSVLDAVGPFSDYFAGAFGDDLYWTVRANERFPIVCVAGALYGYRENPLSITSVLDNRRKVVMPGVLRELLRQRAQTGSDMLERGDLEGLAALEARIAKDRRYLAEQLRIWAARSVDEGRFGDARSLLGKAWANWPLNPALYRTAAYYLKRAAR